MTAARALVLAALIGPALVLGAALASQYLGGLAPCPMCIWQRWPHGLAIALAGLAQTLGPGRAAGAALALGALALLAGAGIAVFHAGVEQGWWQGPSACAGGDVGGMSTEALVERIMSAPLVRCDEIAWSFLGLSMAAWNAILSVILAGLSLAAARAYGSSSASQ